MKNTLNIIVMTTGLSLLLSANACVTVHDRIMQRDLAHGPAEIIKQEIVNRRASVTTTSSDNAIIVQVNKLIDCRKKYVQHYRRTETLIKRDTPLLLWVMLGGEYGLSSVALGLGSMQVISATGNNNFLAGIGILNITLGLGLCSAAALNSLFYRNSARLNEPSELQDSYWGPPEVCDRVPAADVEIELQIADLHLQGFSDAQGIWRAEAPSAIDLHAALLANQGRVRVLIPAAQYDQDHVVTARPAALGTTESGS